MTLSIDAYRLYSRVKEKPKLIADRGIIMITQAKTFQKNYTDTNDTNDIMNALDDAEIESDQDWENETTTWTFDDGSRIIISGDDIKVK